MKISCLPVSIFGDICSGKMDLVDWAKAAKEIGYDGIDLSIMFLKNRTPTYLAKLNKDLQEVGLPLVMMTTYPDFTHPDPVQREREYLYLLGDIALCSELHIQYLRILAGQNHPGIDVEESVANVADYFAKLVPYAQEYGVELLLENHGKPGAWDNVDFTYEPQNFLKICEKIQGLDIGINFDTGNVTAHGENPMDFIDPVLDRTQTIHVTDMEEQGRFSPTTIGTGVTPNPEFFAHIKAKGFDNWLCIEEASGRGLDGIRDAYHYVKETWEQA